MSILKNIPISYQGELNDVKLIQFSVEIDEIKELLPKPLTAYQHQGRALISMVNVNLKKMRPQGVPPALGFSYQHVAFRLVLDDAHLHAAQQPKGIYFLRSFTCKHLLARAGQLMTDYNLTHGALSDTGFAFELEQGEKFLHYAIEDRRPEDADSPLQQLIGGIDRAYCVRQNQPFVTQVLRKHWPIRPITCYHFETNFFKTARLEGAFAIDTPILYCWKAPEKIDWNATPSAIKTTNNGTFRAAYPH